MNSNILALKLPQQRYPTGLEITSNLVLQPVENMDFKILEEMAKFLNFEQPIPQSQ